MSLMMRPKKALHKLIDVLLSGAEPLSFPGSEQTEGKIIHNDKDLSHIFLLTAGYVHIRRCLDDLIITTAFAPELVGIQHYPGLEAHFYMELGPRCRLLAVPRNYAVMQLKKHQLHSEWMALLSFKLAFLYERDRAINQRNALDVVECMIKRFAQIPKEFRDNITLSQFIEERTTLSKSSIQRALSHFRQQGSIIVENGYLISTIFPMTNKYHITE